VDKEDTIKQGQVKWKATPAISRANCRKFVVKQKADALFARFCLRKSACN
jgi:hypothetical protein